MHPTERAAALRLDDEPPWRSPGHDHRSAGKRLLDAFEAFEEFPAFAPARGLVIEARAKGGVAGDAVAAVESDIALTVAVLREANSGTGARARVATIPEAIERIGESALAAIVHGARSFDFFDSTGSWGTAPQSHRLHAVATQRTAARLARMMAFRHTDELLVAALLHDIGKLVLCHADPRYLELPEAATLSPQRRLARERRELGVDHALVGGVMARRWGLPRELAQAIERHHSPSEAGLPGMVQLADLIARFQAGNPVEGGEMRAAADAVGLAPGDLDSFLADAPTQQLRTSSPSPLTPGEQRVVAELARGRVYKEIAGSLGLSVSTVRTHLHNTYRKLGVSDRAQAILVAKENGWI